MKLQMIKSAIAGACALGIVIAAGAASAQPVAYEFEAGIPETIPVTADVDNSIDALVTPPYMGRWGIIRSATLGQQATMALTTAGAQTANTNGTARTIAGGNTPVAGLVEISGAFPATVINVSFDTLVDLVCAACAGGNPDLDLFRVEASTDAPTAGVGGVAAVRDLIVPTNTTGTATTTAGGLLTFNIGVRARTTVGATPYETGAYAGSFDALIQY